MVLLKLMYDLQSYLGKMSAGLISNDRIMQAKYGKKRKKFNRVWQSPKVEAPFFFLKEDDLP